MQYQTPRDPRLQNARPDPGTGGFRINEADLLRSQAPVELDTRSFSLAAGAGAAVGEGLQGLGKGLGEIAGDQFASINRRKVDEADAKLAAAEIEIGSLIANEQDESKWPALFQSEASKWQGELLKDKTLSPAAREMIETKLGAWRLTTDSKVKKWSFERSIQREAQQLEGQRIDALGNGQFEFAESRTEEQLKRGLIGEDVAARQRAQTKNAREEAEKEAIFTAQYDAIKQDPRAWQAAYKSRPEDMDPVLYERLVNLAKRTGREAVASDVDRAENAIATARASGVPFGPAMADEWEKDNPRITPAMREAMRAHIIRSNDAAARQSTLTNAPEIASQLRTEVANFDWDKDGELAYWKLRLRIDELPAPISGEVSGPLEAKFPGRGGEFKVATETKDVVEETLTSMFNSGSFGGWNNGTGKDKDGTPVANPGESPDEVYKRDDRAYEKALREKAIIGGKIRRWLDANPKATPEDAQKKLYELVPEGTRAGLLGMFDSVLPVVPTLPESELPPLMEDGLPNRPGPAENTLLPPPLPQ